MSRTYTWNPQSFSGFYYDLDTNEGKETLTIEDIDRSLGKGDIEYKTEPIAVNFEYGSWGTYNVIGFMADRYFAGYRDSTTFASSSDNLMSKRQLSKVLLDTDKKYNVRAGTALELEEGYEFRITEFGTGGDAVMVGVFKDGGLVAEDIVSEGQTFRCETDLGGARDMPIIAIHIDNVFVGTETSTVVIEGLFQISDSYIDVDPGDEFGLMEINSVSSSAIIMKNDGFVGLNRGDDFNLMGKINIRVADSDPLRFAPYVDMSEPGTYELRGTVTEENPFEWTPFNFEALLYDIDTGDGDETLRVERTSATSRTVAENKLIYTTKPINMKFEHSADGWNEFQSIGFMGDIYFAGYKSTSAFVSSDRSLISKGKLSRILLDEDKKHTLHIGNSLILQEGYSLRIDEISRSGDALMLTVLKDENELRTDIASEGDDFVYEVEVDNTDIPIIVAHIDRVFRGMETNSVFIDGIFQISESFTTVETGDNYGIMEVTSTSSSSIVLKNNDNSFSLGEGDIISIMGDIKIKVADASAVRFYPFQEVVVEEPLYLELDIPSSVYQNEELTIKVTSDGDEIKGASITFGDAEIGTTDSSGELVYTPVDSGTFIVTASMSGYASDSVDLEVLYQPKVLKVSAPQIVDRGKSIVISVTSEGSGIGGASVKFGSKDLGTTPASGNITYTPDEVGSFTISASKSGYQSASQSIDITDPGAKLVFSNLSIKPKRVQPDENVNITVEAANFGTLREAQTMYLKVNGKEVVSHDLVLGPGEIMTLQFTMNRSKPGTYLVEVDGRSDSFKVTGFELGSTGVIVIGIIAILSTTAVIYSIAQGTLTMETLASKAQAFEKMLKHLVEK
ncbi:MAG: S-layer protein domain-containing protein [ANME-2 cluster archaeon]|nr:S-layer protein domain-containing protein [ANME-2 cluster archaeon]